MSNDRYRKAGSITGIDLNFPPMGTPEEEHAQLAKDIQALETGAPMDCQPLAPIAVDATHRAAIFRGQHEDIDTMHRIPFGLVLAAGAAAIAGKFLGGRK